MRKGLIRFLVLLSLKDYSQPPVNFVATLGGDGVDIGYCVRETFGRQYIVVGSTTSFGAGGSDVFVALVDSMGNTVWQRTFGGPGNDVGKSVLINPLDSSFFITGYTSSFGKGGYDVYISNVGKKGNLMWQTSQGGPDWDFGNDLSFAPDGNLVICGKSYGGVFGKSDGLIIKTDLLGNLQKIRFFGGPEDDELKTIEETTDGKITVCGNTKSFGDINNDFWLLKVEVNIDSVLSRNIGNVNKAEFCYDFMEDKLNNLVFCGSFDTSVANSGKNVSYIMKTDLNGNFLSEQKYTGGNYIDKLNSVSRTKLSNDYYFARSTVHPPLAVDFQPVLVDYSYIFLDATTYGDFGDEEIFESAFTSDNGFINVGYTNSYGNLTQDIYLVKLGFSFDVVPSIVGVNVQTKMENKHARYFNDNVVFENSESESLIFLMYDYVGRLVYQNETKNNQWTVPFFLPKGVYLVSCPSKPQLNFKFIKD
jgi:hypothetical protein